MALEKKPQPSTHLLVAVALTALLLGVLAGMTLHDVLVLLAEHAAEMVVAALLLGGGRQ